MPDFDTAAEDQIDSGAFAPADLIFIDFVGDPLRANTSGRALSFTSTGDPDLDGQTFIPFDSQFVDVGDVSDSNTGSDTLSISLSGVQSIDDGLIAEIANKANWQGRTVRLWLQVFDETGVSPQGATVQKYTGYASNVTIHPGPQGSTIELSVEKYLASSSEASNRDYLSQGLFDPGDTSAQATLAAANMGRGAATASAPSGGGIGVSGGSGGSASIMNIPNGTNDAPNPYQAID